LSKIFRDVHTEKKLVFEYWNLSGFLF
jgi:hypothetical protein